MEAPKFGRPRAVWLFIDPRSGTVSAYPSPAAERLEEARSAGTPTVSLAGCGHGLAGVVVQLTDPPQQLTTRGQRDVRRMEIPAGTADIHILTAWEGAWRIEDVAIEAFADTALMSSERAIIEQTLAVSEDQMVDAAEAVASDDPSTQASSSQEGAPPVLFAGAEDEFVGLWEWCLVAGVGDAEGVPDMYWGVYSEAQNESIEAAFLDGASEVEVTIGVQSYTIFFDRQGGGQQVDASCRKVRRVRRRCLHPREKELALRCASEAATAACKNVEGDCAICFADFADTPAMPVVHLPGCGHRFHGACVQQQADSHGTCPLCRADVDWREAYAL
mmetsp:Transcript_55448/g.154514  ORF Transcript_55448/g.154514 Transcript_55448/m.154514 type:complete len:332 (-) Transcript_55448:280-1275(-)